MRRHHVALVVVALILITSRDAAAQPSEQDVAAYAALNLTPIGALSPMLVSPVAKGEKYRSSFAGRLSHFAPGQGEDGNNNFGVTYLFPAGPVALSGTLGYVKESGDGGEGLILGGADLHATLWNNAVAASTSATSLNFQASLGYGRHNDFDALSMAVGFPLALTMMQASKSKFVLFVTPGFGWGRLSTDVLGPTVSESGTRPFAGAGGSWTSAAGWGLHASYNRIFIEDGGNTFGAGFTWRIGQ